MKRPEVLAHLYAALEIVRCQSAILFPSRRLGSDKRKHWRLAKGVNGIVEKEI